MRFSDPKPATSAYLPSLQTGRPGLWRLLVWQLLQFLMRIGAGIRSTRRPRGTELYAVLLICLYSFPSLVPTQPARSLAEDLDMRLRLKDGSFSSGQLVGSTFSDRLGWQTDGFDRPFHIDTQALRSISVVFTADETPEEPLTGQVFELTHGGMIAGQLIAIDSKHVTVRSMLLGDLKISRSRVVSMTDAGYAGEVVYQGPIEADDWHAASNDSDWTFEAGTVVANKQGAIIVGEVNMPQKAQINLVLSWKGVPDFVFSFGTAANNRGSRVEQVPAAARLEVWDKQLALVREVDGGADIALISDLTGANPRIELTLLIDQDAGVVTVCDSYGRPLDSVTAIAKTQTYREAVHLVNHGPSLTLESLEVRKWDGRTKIPAGSEAGLILTTKGETLEGTIRGFDPETSLILVDARNEDVPATIPLNEIRRGDFSTATSSSDAAASSAGISSEDQATQDQNAEAEIDNADANRADANDSSQAEDPAKTASLVEVILLDRSRIRGRWLPAQNGKMRLQVQGVTGADGFSAVAFGPDMIRGLIGTNERFVANQDEHRSGTLKLDHCQFWGYLEEQSPEDADTALFWHPHGSLKASQLLPTSAGAIVYRQQLPRVATQTTNTAERTRNRGNVVMPMLNILLGAQGSGDNTDAASDKPKPLANAREIYFRTADGIDGVVDRIDERGMTFRSNQTSTTFAAHSQIQSIWLNQQIRGSSFSKEKLDRLMTVPRAMKQDPPTHLFVSVTGDYLRARLVRLESGVLTVEVRLELMEIPVEQVAQIIWLHDRDWEQQSEDDGEAEHQAAIEQPFRIHAISTGDRGLTFQPQKVVDGTIYGQSELLGDCSINVQLVNQLLFGRDIGLRVREYRQDPWTLSLAQYPKVYLDDGTGDPLEGNLGMQSPLVGEAAPDFTLKTLTGESFRLSRQRDRVVVLDFWASWCGPCIQTMPMVEQVVEELGTDKIQLVAVNIQEAQGRVEAAVERLELGSTVLLDIDGQVGATYAANAIPQTVIIDREGNVTHLFVGGGSRFVGQFRSALQSVLGIDEELQPE